MNCVAASSVFVVELLLFFTVFESNPNADEMSFCTLCTIDGGSA